MIWEQPEAKVGPLDVDKWWREIESKILEAIVFKSTRVEPVVATRIAPWIPPSCRGEVVNTEYLKSSRQENDSTSHIGCPKMLAELIRKGCYDPLNLKSASTADLLEVCSSVGIPPKVATTKVYPFVELCIKLSMPLFVL